MSLKEKRATKLFDEGLDLCSKRKKIFDYQKAIKFFEKSIKLGNADAAYAMSQMYEKGLGVKKDKNKAFEYFCKAAEMGNEKCLLDLAWGCYTGKGYKKDIDLAVHYWQIGDKHKINLAQYNLAVYYLYQVEQNDGDYSKKISFMREKVEPLLFSASLEPSFIEAIKLMHLVHLCWDAEELIFDYDDFKTDLERTKLVKSDPLITKMYAIACIKGENNGSDYETGFKIFKQLADKGDIIAQYWTGYLYYKGIGVEKDILNAAKYFDMAAQKGFCYAQYSVCILYAQYPWIERRNLKKYITLSKVKKYWEFVNSKKHNKPVSLPYVTSWNTNDEIDLENKVKNHNIVLDMPFYSDKFIDFLRENDIKPIKEGKNYKGGKFGSSIYDFDVEE